MKKILSLFIVMLVVVLSCLATTLSFKFDGSGFIADGAGVLSSEDIDEISYYLDYVREQKGYTVLVVTLNSLDGVPASKIAGTVAEHSNVPDKEDLLVFLVSPSEGKIGVDIGENMKPVLSYDMLNEIINNKMASTFKKGDYSGALKDGVYSILEVLDPTIAMRDITLYAAKRPFEDTSSSIQFSQYLFPLFIVLFGIYALWLLIVHSANKTKLEAGRYPRCGFGRMIGEKQLLFEQEFLEKI